MDTGSRSLFCLALPVMTGAHILITGGAGFIGSHVAEGLLQQGAHVTALDNFDPFYPRALKQANVARLQAYPGFRLLEADIRDQDLAQRLDALPPVTAVIHLAAKAGVLPSIQDPDGYTDVNIRGTQAILNWMRARGVRKLVFGSSSSVYGLGWDGQWHTLNIIVASQQFDYLKPVFLSDTIEVRTRVSRLGHKSFTLEYAIVRLEQDGAETLCGRGSTVMVTFDFEKDHSYPMPDSWRAAILAYEPVAPVQ